jgi:4-hydroxybenzoate polyprenyltransferase
MFLPLFFAGRIFDQDKLLLLVAGFFGFSFSASFIYVLNDYRDIESDRSHPEKKNRPLASGAISPAAGLTLALLLLLSGLSIGYFLDFGFLTCLFFYVVLNVAYSLKLKHIPILDTSIIATGFVLRIIAGAEIADVPTSKWIILMTFLLALLLGFAKRRDDVLIFNESGKKLRKSIDGYNLDFINLSMILMAGIVIMSYILYTLSPEVVQRWKTENLYLTAFPVILGILRYLQLTFVENRSGNPTRILLKDIIIQSVIAVWIVLFYLIIYMHKIL